MAINITDAAVAGTRMAQPAGDTFHIIQWSLARAHRMSGLGRAVHVRECQLLIRSGCVHKDIKTWGWSVGKPRK